ncbi:predicted protein [Lichtheimia corymbifera JMRC:FSU:9682]|uniref:Uncharacterized protein n=1 Tax=Lichtheimia corymbifera JMRC:FSU:9682 TaxID=1263082 RepID=A0A068RZ05_9FUNG|nr:predicted protein [Lichtheimia corymbifera JMRC:FSU:9682]
MFFVFEAFHRRPYESRIIAYARMAVAVVLALAFFAYCVYIIYQVRFDKTLLRQSTEPMQSPYEVPFVEICAQDSGITFPRCDMMHMNWSYSTLEDCNGYVTKGDEEGTESQCYLLDTEGAYKYGVEEDYDEDAPEVRRVDIYWKLDSVQNVTEASISIPTVTIQIYDPRFNPWNDAVLDSMIPQEKQFYTEMQQGDARSTSLVNWTSAIFFSPLKYRAIRPGDGASLLGFEPTFVDIYTIDTTEMNWPMHYEDNVNLTNGDYHGMFSVQLAKAKYDVKTEQRQHSLLSALAAAGGAYGAITAVYALLFGMVRHSPWGLLDTVAFSSGRVSRKLASKRSNGNNSSNTTNEMSSSKPSKPLLYPTRGYNKSADSSPVSSEDEGVEIALSNIEAPPPSANIYPPASDIRYAKDPSSPTSIDPTMEKLENVVDRVQFLEERFNNLQHVLGEYYLDMDNFKAIQSATQVRRRRREPSP